jgi:DNA repair protein RadC
VAAVDPVNSEQIASSLLAEFRSLSNIWSQSPEALARVLSAWPSIVPLIIGARDAAIGCMISDLNLRVIDPFDPGLRNYLIASMGSLPDERLRILFLDSSRHLIADEELQHGSLSQMAIYPRTIFRRALEHNAASIIVIHNHPSGDAKPSEEDVLATRRLDHIGRALDIVLLDHIVVTAGGVHHIVNENVMNSIDGTASFRLKSSEIAGRPLDQIILHNARKTIRRRLLRRQLIGAAELFGEPAWDMLLDLFIHECEGEQLSMFSMCAGSGIPVSSAMRLAQKLCDAEILRRCPDPSDRRRSIMTIDPDIAHRIRAYFSEGVE